MGDCQICCIELRNGRLWTGSSFVTRFIQTSSSRGSIFLLNTARYILGNRMLVVSRAHALGYLPVLSDEFNRPLFPFARRKIDPIFLHFLSLLTGGTSALELLSLAKQVGKYTVRLLFQRYHPRDRFVVRGSSRTREMKLILRFSSSHDCIGRSGREFEPQDLMGHHFFVVRAMEGGEEQQDKLAKEFFETCEEYDC